MSHECQCEGAGHCPRFGRPVNARQYQTCSGRFPPGVRALSLSVRLAYVRKWSEGKGTVASPPSGLSRKAGRFSLACVRRGDPTGESRPCKTCGGTKDVPLYACEVHGVCSAEGPRVEGVRWCRTCPDKVAPATADLPPARS